MYKGKRKIGSDGEQEAQKFLISKGFFIVETNFKCVFGEIDIICKKDNYIFFVEVKFRNSDIYGSGTDAIDVKKIRHIRNSAEAWITENGENYKNFDYDFIALVYDNGKFEMYSFS